MLCMALDTCTFEEQVRPLFVHFSQKHFLGRIFSKFTSHYTRTTCSKMFKLTTNKLFFLISILLDRKGNYPQSYFIYIYTYTPQLTFDHLQDVTTIHFLCLAEHIRYKSCLSTSIYCATVL